MLGGKCRGLSVVREYWENHYGSGECKHCIQFDKQTAECQVINEQEDPAECPVLSEFVYYNEIKI